MLGTAAREGLLLLVVQTEEEHEGDGLDRGPIFAPSGEVKGQVEILKKLNN